MVVSQVSNSCTLRVFLPQPSVQLEHRYVLPYLVGLLTRTWVLGNQALSPALAQEVLLPPEASPPSRSLALKNSTYEELAFQVHDG